MAFSRRLGVIGILGASWLVAVGCGSDDNKNVNAGGEAGEAGESTGGTPSSGGSNNNAGKGGTSTAGKGGSGGKAGSGGTAGSGGNAGSTSQAGMTGEAGAGGAVEMPTGGAPNGGAGGASGAGGAGGASAEARSCDYQCNTDDDCKKGIDATEKCDPTTKRCQDPNAVCAVDSDCLANVSQWTVSCLDDAGCFADVEACVTSNGKGYCASLPDPNFPDFPCVTGVVLSVARFGTQGNVDVCGSPDPRCFGGKCAAGCSDPDQGGCNNGEGNVCNTNTGLCECDTNDDCASNLCDNRRCLDCATSDDCAASAASTGLDTCVNGKCSCSGSQVCLSGGYDSATPVCE